MDKTSVLYWISEAIDDAMRDLGAGEAIRIIYDSAPDEAILIFMPDGYDLDDAIKAGVEFLCSKILGDGIVVYFKSPACRVSIRLIAPWVHAVAAGRALVERLSVSYAADREKQHLKKYHARRVAQDFWI